MDSSTIKHKNTTQCIYQSMPNAKPCIAEIISPDHHRSLSQSVKAGDSKKGERWANLTNQQQNLNFICSAFLPSIELTSHHQ